MENGELERLLLRARGLAVLRGVLRSDAARDLLSLLSLLSGERPDPDSVAETFGGLWEELAVEPGDLLPDVWQSHLVGRLLDDENPFSLAAESGELAPALVEQTRRDLRTLRSLFDLEAKTLVGLVEAAAPGLEGVWTPWRNPEPNVDLSRYDEVRRTLACKLAAAKDWGD